LPIDEQRIQVPPGGTLLLYSDGVNETVDYRGVEFGINSLARTLTTSRTRPAQEICEQLWQDVQAYGEGIPQQDDFTAVVVKRSMS
jgi:serine phosphatase RsbU (regulator of sigma subunit)